MDLLMDDRVPEAQKLLDDGNSPYFKLARGVIHFIEATLSFEPESIKHASDSLYEAEQAAAKERSRSQKSSISSSSYPPGTEWSVAYAESQLLGAITLFLSESVIDSARALYKLRKAYQVLDEVNRVVTKTDAVNAAAANNNTTAGGSAPSSTLSSSATPASKGSPTSSSSSVSNQNIDALSLQVTADQQITEMARRIQVARIHRSLGTGADTEALTKSMENLTFVVHGRAGHDSVDEYIRSAICACFGILQLVISIIPAGLGRVLSIVGFRGTKEEGLDLLWKAVDKMNVHGAIALLALLQYYDGPTQFSDIELPTSNGEKPATSPSVPRSESFSQSITRTSTKASTNSKWSFKTSKGDELAETKLRLKVSLAKARDHYSRGSLWQLQQGRMLGAQGRLVEAIAVMDDTSRGPIQMRQVEGLMLFDKTMMTILLHDFELSAYNYLRLIKLNSWSHAFYTFLSAICQLELYRDYKKKVQSSEGEASHSEYQEKEAAAKSQTRKLLDHAPTLMGKKGFMAKTMPFDVFVTRKIHQWNAAARENRVDLVDAVGASPIHEVMYFWNGYSRMPKEYLEKSLGLLECRNGHEHEDDETIRYMLQSVILRNLGRLKEGVELLESKVLSRVWTVQKGYITKSGLPKVHFIRTCREPWLPPSAIYERAVFEWRIHGLAHAERVMEYLDRAGSWADDYELSTRVGLRIKSAQDNLQYIMK